MSRFTSALIVIAIVIGMIPAPPSIANGTIRVDYVKHHASADFTLGTLDGVVSPAVEDGGLSLSAGRQSGQFTSPVLETEFEFNAVGVNWTDEVPELGGLEIELRVSRDGMVWKDWGPIEDGDIPSKYDQHASDLFFLAGSFVQYRVTFTANAQGQGPVLKTITIKYIDSKAGPDITQARASAARTLGTSPLSQPFIISRAGWGSPEPYSSVNWPPEYSETRTSIVHHTATPMDSDPAAAVRTIWYDHAILRGWGDIGYNYLVDTYGNIYEGRFGGDNVVAGHAGNPYNYGSLGIALIGTYVSIPPSPPAASSLVDVLAWKFNWHGIDPTGVDWFYDKYVGKIMGHLDVGSTECPGSSLYARLGGIRGLTKYREGWGWQGTPQTMSPGQTAWVRVDLLNRGAQTWYPGGYTSFDLGYHWYKSDGSQYVQSPQDDHRTPVPWAVGYDQWVTVDALLTAPTVPGTYRLEWDMVQENVTWFTSIGNSPLVVMVTVENPSATPTTAPTNTPTPTPTSTPTNTPTFTPTPVPPTLRLGTSFVGFVTSPGAGPRPSLQVVNIQNAGIGTFDWLAIPSSQGDWLKVSPSSISQLGPLTVWVDQSVLGASVYTPAVLEGSILIQAEPGVHDSPQTITVRLAIGDQIRVSYLPLVQKFYTDGW